MSPLSRSSENRPNLIAVDLTLATRRSELTGIERYGLNLFTAIRRLRPNTIAVVTRGGGFAGRPGFIEVAPGLLSWALLPARLKLLHRVDVLVCPSFPVGPSIFLPPRPRTLRVIHDAFPWTRQDTGLKSRLLFKHYEGAIASRCNVVCAPTALVAHELSNILGFPVDECGNGPGLDIECLDTQKPQLPFASPFAAAVGTIEPRKNYGRIVSLASSLAQLGLKTVIVGRAGWGDDVDALMSLRSGGPSPVTWLGSASDPETAWVIRNSAVFLSLSHGEGFNMPLVEAGIAGRKIVCSDLPIHRRVAPPWAVFVDNAAPLDDAAKAVSEAINVVVEPSERSAYAERWGWPRVASRVIDLIEAAP